MLSFVPYFIGQKSNKKVKIWKKKKIRRKKNSCRYVTPPNFYFIYQTALV